jgi:hypothetical protein
VGLETAVDLGSIKADYNVTVNIDYWNTALAAFFDCCRAGFRVVVNIEVLVLNAEFIKVGLSGMAKATPSCAIDCYGWTTHSYNFTTILCKVKDSQAVSQIDEAICKCLTRNLFMELIDAPAVPVPLNDIDDYHLLVYSARSANRFRFPSRRPFNRVRRYAISKLSAQAVLRFNNPDFDRTGGNTPMQVLHGAEARLAMVAFDQYVSDVEAMPSPQPYETQLAELAKAKFLGESLVQAS